MFQTTKIAFIYFGIVFGIGFLLGTIRVIFLLPYMEERWAELFEMPFMLIAITLTARYLVHKYPAVSLRTWLYIGFLALLLLLCVEFTIVLGIREISFFEYIDSRDVISGSAYIVSLIIYMLMPSYIYKYHHKFDSMLK